MRNIEGAEETIPLYRSGVKVISGGKAQDTTLYGIDSTKLPLVIPTLEMEGGELVSSNDATDMILGNKIAHPAGEDAPFGTVESLASRIFYCGR